MTFTYCALCRKVIFDKDIIDLETCDNDDKGLSIKICRSCEDELRVKSEKNYLMILLEGELK